MAENPVQTPPPIGSTTPPANSDKDARMWCMLCHLAIILSCLGLVCTIIIWQTKKTEFPLVDVHGKRALNFQLSVFIACLAIGMAAFVLSFVHLGFIGLLNPLIWLGAIILGIMAGIK